MKRKPTIIASFGSYQERLTIWVRWAVLFLALLLVSVAPEAAGRSATLHLTILGAAAYNILLFFSNAAMLQFVRRRWITLGVDLAFTTLLVACTTGHNSQFFYLYLLAIVWAALAAGRQTALRVTVLAAGLYLLALWSRQELSWDSRLLYDLLFKVSLLSLTALWAGLIADQQKIWASRTSELSSMADEWSKAASYNQTAALFGIGAMMSSSTSIEETLNLTLDAVADIIHSDRCSILLLDPRTNELVLRAARGFRAGAVGKLRLRSDQGVAGEVLRTGLPLNIPDTDQEPSFVPSPQGYDKIRSMLVMPLVVKEKRIGVINISEVNGPRRFTNEELNAIKLVATYTAVALQNAGILEEKEREAITDGLTGLYNYRYFLEQLEKATADARQHGQGLALIWMDLDHFKEYNDAFGHLKGSEILKRLGSIIDNATGAQQKLICRYGGDEFAVILFGAGRDQGLEAAERIRLGICRTEFAERRPDGQQLSASLGVAAFPQDAADPRGLIDRADQAMYQAKQHGKNRTAYWQTDTINIRSAS